MSYVVLARKYRPKHFGEMVGQSHVVTALGNALSTQRLHHAYLFTGTRGVGKTTVSRILAKSLNCVGPDGQGTITATPCGVCPACTDIDAGRFVDYTELDAASNRGVDEVQALLEQAVYKPVQGRFKVFMIDEVHMLTNTAFNAMLKTLEEPPDYLKFVLATTDPQKVPVTVLSRCLQFNLRPMAPETVFEHLGRVLEAESVSAEPAALRLLARAAHGSMRDALSLTDQAIAFGGGRLQEDAVRQMLGVVGRGPVFALLGALAEGNGAAVVDTVEQLRLQGLSAASTLDETIHVLQRMAVSQVTRAAPDPADPEAPEVQRLAQALPPDQTQLLYSLCLQGRQELGWAPDEYAALVMVLLRLLAFRPAEWGQPEAEKKSPRVSPQAAESPNTRAVSRPVTADAPAPQKPAVPAPQGPQGMALAVASPLEPGDAAPAPAQAQVDVNEAAAVPSVSTPLPVASSAPVQTVTDASAADFWTGCVRQLLQAEAVTALTRELALQSQLVQRDETASPPEWTLQVDNTALAQAGLRDRLQAALVALGHDVRLSVRSGPTTDTTAQRLAHEAAQRQLALERQAHDDPLVAALMRDYGGKMVPGSLKPLSTE